MIKDVLIYGLFFWLDFIFAVMILHTLLITTLIIKVF